MGLSQVLVTWSMAKIICIFYRVILSQSPDERKASTALGFHTAHEPAAGALIFDSRSLSLRTPGSPSPARKPKPPGLLSLLIVCTARPKGHCPRGCWPARSPAHSVPVRLSHAGLCFLGSLTYIVQALFMSFHSGVVLPQHGRHPHEETFQFSVC